jgi:endonuclease/exonuclease/phosphatase family metal-dependent hydrolase
MPPESLMLAGGDFNVTSEEDAAYGVYERGTRDIWAVSHELGCAECPGTNYYPPKRSWSFLDAILVSRNMSTFGSAPWRVDPDSIRIADGAPHQKDARGRPVRFDPLDGTGVSDHFPVVLDLVKRR